MTQAVVIRVRFKDIPDPGNDEEADAMLDEIQKAIESLPHYQSSEIEDFEDE